MSESEQTMSHRANRGFNTSGCLSYFRFVCEISKATLLLGERKNLYHRQRQRHRQCQSFWQQRCRSESEWSPFTQEKRRFFPLGWISFFRAVPEIAEATLLLGECKILSHCK